MAILGSSNKLGPTIGSFPASSSSVDPNSKLAADIHLQGIKTLFQETVLSPISMVTKIFFFFGDMVLASCLGSLQHHQFLSRLVKHFFQTKDPRKKMLCASSQNCISAHLLEHLEHQKRALFDNRKRFEMVLITLYPCGSLL